MPLYQRSGLGETPVTPWLSALCRGVKKGSGGGAENGGSVDRGFMRPMLYAPSRRWLLCPRRTSRS
jgi:hypothetical protein